MKNKLIKVKINDTEVTRALKILYKINFTDSDRIKMMQHEADIMRKINHPNIMQLYEFSETKDNL